MVRSLELAITAMRADVSKDRGGERFGEMCVSQDDWGREMEEDGVSDGSLLAFDNMRVRALNINEPAPFWMSEPLQYACMSGVQTASERERERVRMRDRKR